MANPFKRKKDEVGNKRKENKKVPYRKCGVPFKTKRMPNGSVVTLYCTKNGNVPHRHGN
jgi:hypothetical protein